jgi:hypothetical protein
MTVLNKEIVRQALAVIREREQGSEEYECAAYALHHAMGGSHRESLSQLVNHGPVHDGDVIAKSLRDDLIHWGLAQRVCVKGEQGYTGANYVGWDVLRAGQR